MSIRSVTFQLKWRGVSGGTKSISSLDSSGWCVLRAKLAIRPESFLCRQLRDVLCADALAQKGNSTRATASTASREPLPFIAATAAMLGFIQPWLTVAELDRYYSDEYGRYRHGLSLEKRQYRRGWQRYVLENRYNYSSENGATPNAIARAIAFLLSFFTAKGVIPYRGSGRILDVGCGGGSYLYRLKQWGWDTVRGGAERDRCSASTESRLERETGNTARRPL